MIPRSGNVSAIDSLGVSKNYYIPYSERAMNMLGLDSAAEEWVVKSMKEWQSMRGGVECSC